MWSNGMNRDQILDLAQARAKARTRLQALGMMNAAGRSLEEEVAASAQYQLAADAAAKADRDYQDAIRSLSAAELNELADAAGVYKPA
jgi:hypothetical protein